MTERSEQIDPVEELCNSSVVSGLSKIRAIEIVIVRWLASQEGKQFCKQVDFGGSWASYLKTWNEWSIRYTAPESFAAHVLGLSGPPTLLQLYTCRDFFRKLDGSFIEVERFRRVAHG
jgi:hypothetical protein